MVYRTYPPRIVPCIISSTRLPDAQAKEGGRGGREEEGRKESRKEEEEEEEEEVKKRWVFREEEIGSYLKEVIPLPLLRILRVISYSQFPNDIPDT